MESAGILKCNLETDYGKSAYKVQCNRDYRGRR